jgi:DNA repair protein RadC
MPDMIISELPPRILSSFYRTLEEISLHPYETFILLALDSRFKLLRTYTWTDYHPAKVTLDPATIVRSAILAHATNIIIGHNHPTDNTEPSTADLAITKEIKKLCGQFSIRLIDHIISSPTKTKNFSFQAKGIL